MRNIRAECDVGIRREGNQQLAQQLQDLQRRSFLRDPRIKSLDLNAGSVHTLPSDRSSEYKTTWNLGENLSNVRRDTNGKLVLNVSGAMLSTEQIMPYDFSVHHFDPRMASYLTPSRTAVVTFHLSQLIAAGYLLTIPNDSNVAAFLRQGGVTMSDLNSRSFHYSNVTEGKMGMYSKSNELMLDECSIQSLLLQLDRPLLGIFHLEGSDALILLTNVCRRTLSTHSRRLFASHSANDSAAA